MRVSNAEGATLVWFRQDLRLSDNPALHAAATRGMPVIPVYVWSPSDEGDWPLGGASRWWLHESLRALDTDLRNRGLRLILARGPTVQALTDLATRCSASALYWNRRYEPAAVRCSRLVARTLRAASLQTIEFNASLLTDPAQTLNASGAPYQVYTAFRNKVQQTLTPGRLLPVPPHLSAPRRWPVGATLAQLELLPRVRWYESLAAVWKPGEATARAALRRFLAQRSADYPRTRDRPAVRGTSRLSPHLHFGEIGPRQVWRAFKADGGRDATFLHELLWREFAYHLLHHFPHTAREPLRARFRRFPWHRDSRKLRAWQRGMTGLPLVDAGMRELWSTGWMHNRVRMVTASFLVKNLLIPWQQGAQWFWDTLVDADLANNSLNWQWVAGCGADAAPYFRIFNPNSQAQRFDPGGQYIDNWIPELRGGTRTRYPHPIVDLQATREAALRAYKSIGRASGDRGRL
ncbi:MAG TPA: deoxyribodipyrimidine photo-lyase [Steroidobacteraceae bacterium]|nr:deoxyribodipyrimidine photo-lyase [Steroidobacteraceae bacterium]